MKRLILKGCIQIILYRAGKARITVSVQLDARSLSRRALICLGGADESELGGVSHVVRVKTTVVVILNCEEGLVIRVSFHPIH